MFEAIIFDLDGTLLDSRYDWKEIHTRVGAGNKTILEFISGLNGEKKKKAIDILEKYEDEATKNATLKDGVLWVLSTLSKHRIKTGLVTNNSKKNVDFIVKSYGIGFDIIITRDDGVWKPGGNPINIACKKLKVSKKKVIFVGDSDYDTLAARNAKVAVVIVGTRQDLKEKPDYRIENIKEILEIIENVDER
jgi:HAD superfamily hydrolase (TIGR01549 family)